MNFGFRTYNPTIGLFDGADLLGDLNNSVTPLSFVNGDPVNNVDIDGLYAATNGFTGMHTEPDDPSKRVIITQNPGSMEDIPNHSKASIAVSEGNYAALRAEREIRADATGVSRSSTPFVPRPNVAVWPPAPVPQLREDTRFKEGTQYTQLESASQLGYNMGSIASLASIKNILKVPKFTKSTLAFGQQMHKEYKLGNVLNRVRIKEFRLPSGKRIDFIDFEKKIIYELKPNNPRSISAGKKQLKYYLEEVEKTFGKGWKTVLETY